MKDTDADLTLRFLCTENIAMLGRIIAQTTDMTERARLQGLLSEQKTKLQFSLAKSAARAACDA
jgi:hypothetical protein